MPSQIFRAFRAILNLSTYLGLLLIAFIWGGLTYYLSSEYEKEVHSTKVEMGNLARVLEQHLIRTIAGMDRSLQYMRASYLESPGSLNFNHWAASVGTARETHFDFSLVGLDGSVKASTRRMPEGHSISSDPESARFHAERANDELYIGKPVRDASTNKWSLHFSRAIRNSGGYLLGIVEGIVDPYDLIHMYEKLDLGRDGSILLIGMDGIVRAVHGLRKETLGTTLPLKLLDENVRQSPSGWFLGSGATDGVRRYVSYRVVRDQPLVMSMGVSAEEFLARYENTALTLRFIASILTAAILLALMLHFRRQLLLDKAHAELRETREFAVRKSNQLEVVLDHIDKAILMEDEAGKIVVYNHLAPGLLGVSEDFLKSQPTRRQLLACMWSAGEFGPDGSLLEPRVREYLNPDSNPEDGLHYERVRPNGMILETKFRHLPGGGYVRAFVDITERKRAEARISHMATHDPLTGLANRALLQERVQTALARMERFGEGFALFCFDLDGFKKINDTMGHAVGDQLLQEISGRLRRAIRDIDTAARTGGDEFVILQASTNSQDQAIVLAERVRQTMGLPVSTKAGPVAVGTSIGIALAPRHGTNEEDLFKAADSALYRAKASGRNLFRFASAPKNDQMPPNALSVMPALPKTETVG